MPGKIVKNKASLSIFGVFTTMRAFLVLFIMILLPMYLYPQSDITISGFVLDSATGEKLIGASIFDSLSNHYSITNNNGFYSIRVNAGNQNLRISYVGYSARSIKSGFMSDTFLNTELVGSILLHEVTIYAGNSNQVQIPGMPGLKNLPIEIIENMPAIMGEQDVMRSAQMLPGVQGGSEANTGLYVRGGEGDQNLVLLDGVEVFNPDHLFGFFSVFNDDAFKSVRMYTSGFPAKYNGRLSSVLDIRTKDGDSRKTHVNGSIGIISSKLQIQGPLIRDKLTYIVSYRRTYLGILAKPIIRHFTDYSDAGYYFQDLNARLRWKINSRNTITVSNYYGGDYGYFKKTNINGIDPPDTSGFYSNFRNTRNFDWGNNLLVGRWENAVSKNLFLNVSASASRYDYNGRDENIEIMKYWLIDSLIHSDNKYSLRTESGIMNYTGLVDVDYFLSPQHKINVGTGVKYFQLSPEVERLNSSNVPGARNINNLSSQEFSGRNYFMYLEDEITLFRKLKIVPGIHYSNYSCEGSENNSLLKRLSFDFHLTDNLGLHGTYSEMEQYLHRLSLSRLNLASDLWLPSFGELKPARSREISAGIDYSVSSFNAGVDVFMKNYENLLSYKEGVSFIQSPNTFLDLVTSGAGKSRGIEFFTEKTGGKITGLASYTYSRSLRRFSEINFGEEFPARYDRPHIFKTFINYTINPAWKISAIWILMSGNLNTIASKNYISWFEYQPKDDIAPQESGNNDILYYQKNSYRLPAYHRLDLAVSFTKKYRSFTGVLNFGAYNAYNAQNAYDVQMKLRPKTIYQGQNYDYFLSRELDKKVLFPILPFISYSIEI
jgi:outer membrane receptor for ferrienterochelin and colicin